MGDYERMAAEAIAAAALAEQQGEPEPFHIKLGSTGRKVYLPDNLQLVEVSDLAAFFAQAVNANIQRQAKVAAAAEGAQELPSLTKRGFVVAGH